MRALLSFWLVVLLAGCIPIGIRGTSITASDTRACGKDAPAQPAAATPIQPHATVEPSARCS